MCVASHCFCAAASSGFPCNADDSSPCTLGASPRDDTVDAQHGPVQKPGWKPWSPAIRLCFLERAGAVGRDDQSTGTGTAGLEVYGSQGQGPENNQCMAGLNTGTLNFMAILGVVFLAFGVLSSWKQARSGI